MTAKQIADEVQRLVHSSVQDLHSTLRCARDNDQPFPEAVLETALAVADANGFKTKARMLQSELRRVRRESA